MNFWGKISLGVLGAGAVAGLWFGDEYYSKKEEEDKKTSSKALNFEAANVRKITLTNSNGRFVFERESAQASWAMLEPKTVKPDQDTLNNMLAALTNAQVERELVGTENETKDALSGGATAAQYGLEKPRTSIELGLEGNKTQKLLIGNDINVGSSAGTTFNALSVYGVTPDRKNLLVMGSAVVSNTNKTFADLRTRTAGDFKTSDVKGFTVARGDNPLVEVSKEVKEGQTVGVWKITKPQDVAADSNNVGLFLDKVARLRVDKVTEPDALNEASLAGFGLATPAAVVEMKGEGGKVLQSLKFGVSKDSAYVTLPDGAVGAFELGSFADLAPDLKFFRDRRVMRDANMGEVTKIKTLSGKVFQKDGANWYGPGANPLAAATVSATPAAAESKPAQAEKVSDRDAAELFSQWEFMTADDVIEGAPAANLAEFGLDKPLTRFALEFTDAAKPAVEILVGNRVPKNEKAVYVKRGDKPQIFIVETQWLDALTRMDQSEGKSPQATK